MPAVLRIIVGASGSPGSLRALRYAQHLARDYHATLMPVLAWLQPGGDLADRRTPLRGVAPPLGPRRPPATPGHPEPRLGNTPRRPAAPATCCWSGPAAGAPSSGPPGAG